MLFKSKICDCQYSLWINDFYIFYDFQEKNNISINMFNFIKVIWTLGYNLLESFKELMYLTNEYGILKSEKYLIYTCELFLSYLKYFNFYLKKGFNLI